MTKLMNNFLIYNILLIAFFINSNGVFSQNEYKYYNATDFEIIGKGFNKTENPYDRLSVELKDKVPANVWRAAQRTAGLAIRFRTNSPFIAVRWTVANNTYMNHMTSITARGVDLYCLVKRKWEFVSPGRPAGSKTNNIQIIGGLEKKEMEYMLYLPLFDGVEKLEIGIDANTQITKPSVDSPRKEKPIVVYGGSVVQGACVSRPGMAYTSQLSRMLDRQVINLGFDAPSRFEDVEIAKAMAEIDASCFIIDCIANNTFAKLKDNFFPFINEIRAMHPEVPIVIVGNNYIPQSKLLDRRLNEMEGYEKIAKELYYELKDKHRNTIYVDGFKDMEISVDGIHYTDLGANKRAQELYDNIRKKIK